MAQKFTRTGFALGVEADISRETTWADSTNPLTVTTGTLHRIYATYDRSISSVHASVSVPNSGGTTTFDIKTDGTTILSSDLTIADTNYESTVVTPTTTDWDDGSYLTVEITGVTGGAGMATVAIEWSRR